MIIVFRSNYPPYRIFAQAFWVIAALFAFVSALFLTAFFKPLEFEELYFRKGALRTYAFDKIFTGPLALRESGRSPLALALEHKLVLLARSTRPDIGGGEKVFCIGIEGSDASCLVKEGEALSLSWTLDSAGGVETLSFSEEGVAAKAEALDSRCLLLKTDTLELLLKADAAFIEPKDGGGPFATLDGATWWGEDCFYRQYGGKEYGHLGDRQMLEVGPDFLFVKEGDYLSFSEGKWNVLSSIEKGDKEAPLAFIRSISNEGIGIEAWDAEGFLLLDGEIERGRVPPLNLRVDQLFTECRMRSSTQVSCLLEKKRMLLKVGDWLLKGESGWTKLKTLPEIEAYLNHELNGPLFVVDAIDPKGSLQGHFFDEKRVQAQPVSLVIKQQQRQGSRMAQAIRRGLQS